MVHIPKINRKIIKEKGLFNEARFYRLLSEQNNYVDPKTVKDFYMGLVRLITKEMKENGVIRLPHLGDFALVRMKDKMGLSGKIRTLLTGKYMVKFYIKDTWKDYFVALQNKTGRDGALDPREKLMNMNLDDIEGLK